MNIFEIFPGNRVKDKNDFIGSGETLEGEDQLRLISIVNSSLRIFNDHQFYTWAQCEIQYLISHEILICGIWVGTDPQPRLYSFSSSRNFQDEQIPSICDPSEGLLAKIMTRARKFKRGFILSRELSIGDYDKSWLEMLERNKLDNIVARGLSGSDGQLKSFFCFFNVTGTISNRLLYVLEVLLPILDSTLTRVVANLTNVDEASQPKTPALGEREIQIIKLIKVGKTNQVIADELFISPLTVKNHVQNILKKLKVKTRGHAVTKAIDLGLLNRQ